MYPSQNNLTSHPLENLKHHDKNLNSRLPKKTQLALSKNLNPPEIAQPPPPPPKISQPTPPEFLTPPELSQPH